jgi:pantothenate kinase
VLVVPKIDLALTFKKENPPKNYRFTKDKQIDIPQNVFSYLEDMYPGSFKKIVPLVSTIDGCFETLETKEIDGKDNLLNLLLSTEKEDSIEELIEKALKGDIIVKQGPWYKFKDKMYKGILKVKEDLEKNKDLVNYLKENLKTFSE